MVEGHENIKMSNSIVDYVFRALGLEYLNRTDIVQNPPEESPSAPVQESPSAPVQESPSAPVQESPSAPVQESPSAPVDEITEPVVEVQETEPPSSSKTTEVSNEVTEVQFVTKVKEVEALDTIEATSNSVTTVQEVLGDMMGDAPACPDCGHITIRNGSCYKCLNCGNSLGCS
jgi:ribonucleoside-diphosphate reductase alpha chain